MEESICDIFQDIILANSSLSQLPLLTGGLSSTVLPPAPKNASSMPLAELLRELEKRSLPAKGFYCDDAKTLQAAFDSEHESQIETMKKELLDKQIVEARDQALRQQQEFVRESSAEEERLMASDVRIAACFKTIKEGDAVHCRIEGLTDISTRSLSKLLWTDKHLVTVDVSNMNLSDVSGAFLGRSLRNNTTLKRLEMGGNQFCSRACLELAESLLANNGSALCFLSLESNPLATGDNNKESIALLAKAVGANTSLVSLSLWRCGLGINDGKLFAQAIINGNSTLVSLEMGYNLFDNLDVEAIARQLVSTYDMLKRKQTMYFHSHYHCNCTDKDTNRKYRAAKLAREAELAEKQRQEIQSKIEEELAQQKELDKAKWLAREEAIRADARRREAEERKLGLEKEAQLQKAREQAQKMEDARVKMSKKKSKGKKGGKKK
jgi:hypothetical protein